jgi:type IV pilus assembly protein PilE
VKKKNGFTLIEMLIVLAMVGVLAAIAFPSYQEQVRKSRRTAVKGQLQEVQQNMERWYTLRNTYVGFALGSSVVSPPGTSGTRVFYNVDYAVGPAVSTYTLRATPVNAQIDDRCGVLTIAQNGVKTPTTPGDCW